MRRAFFISLLGMYFLSPLSALAIEEESIKPQVPSSSHHYNAPIAMENDTPVGILGKSFAYGFIKGTIQESGQCFETVLHNVLVTKGTDGAAELLQALGGLAGDQTTKLAINMSLQMLIETASGPIGGPGIALKTANALAMLDGIFARLVINRIQASMDGLKDWISVSMGKAIGRGAQVLTEYALDQITELTINYIDDFIATRDLTAKYDDIIHPIFKYLTKGTGYHLDYATQMTIFAMHPLADVKRELENTVKAEAYKRLGMLQRAGRYIGSVSGHLFGKVIGNYTAHEIADRYIKGLGKEILNIFLDYSALRDLAFYRDLSPEDYQKICFYEQECRKQEQKKLFTEQEYTDDQATNQDDSWFQYLTTPFTHIAATTKYYGDKLVQQISTKVHENLTPEVTYKLGKNAGVKLVDDLLMKILENQGYDTEKATGLLKDKQDKTFYYTIGKYGFTVGKHSLIYGSNILKFTTQVAVLGQDYQSLLKFYGKQYT